MTWSGLRNTVPAGSKTNTGETVLYSDGAGSSDDVTVIVSTSGGRAPGGTSIFVPSDSSTCPPFSLSIFTDTFSPVPAGLLGGSSDGAGSCEDGV